MVQCSLNKRSKIKYNLKWIGIGIICLLVFVGKHFYDVWDDSREKDVYVCKKDVICEGMNPIVRKISRKPVTGTIEEYYPSGKLIRRGYVENGETLSVKSYYENGALQEETSFKNRQPEGVVKKYYENGQLMSEAYYKNGKLDGEAKHYYSNGQISKEGTFKNGKVEGIWKNYYENGNIQTESHSKNGLLDGEAKKYYPYGAIAVEEIYQEGRLIRRAEY